MKLIAWLIISFLSTSFVYGDRLLVAVASNFAQTLAELTPEFESRSGHTIAMIRGSTGKLYAQILSGAPYDIFMAADAKRPAMLEEAGKGTGESRRLYAEGKLVLWSTDPELVDDSGVVLSTARFKHLAMANPDLAPYGRAALQVLDTMSLINKIEGRLVYGENIAQTYQFISTENAELGFISYSQLLNVNNNSGSWWLIPDSFYEPVSQEMITLRGSAAAEEFTAFLQGDYARALIARSGYRAP